jgi:hypothetical protein
MAISGIENVQIQRIQIVSLSQAPPESVRPNPRWVRPLHLFARQILPHTNMRAYPETSDRIRDG